MKDLPSPRVGSVTAHLLLVPAVCLAVGCAWSAAGDTGCRPVAEANPLPESLKESSGVAWSRAHPGVLWSHNDGRARVLYALDTQGSLIARIPFSGSRIRDWEDLSIGDCEAGSCLYLADTGDNQEVRPGLQLLRIPEPSSLEAASQSLAVDVFPFTLPDGPRDIEALFVLPGEEVFFLSKGRSHPVTLYRYPPPLREGETVKLEAIQDLSDGPKAILAQITGADASPDGNMVVVRSYVSLSFYRVQSGRLSLLEGGRVALRTLQEPQGEGVAIGPDGRVALSTEGGTFGGVAALQVLECPGVIGG